MALEIERRFLVCGEAWRPLVRWTRALQQGYLAGSADGLTLRVRSDGGDGAWLTLKYPAAGIARQEFEYAIPPADAEALLERSGSRVCKARHGLALPGGDWVLDVFSGDNAPLVIAEVELEQADQAITLPAWCSLEITSLGQFSNAALAQRPFASWTSAEQRPWLAALQLSAGAPPGAGCSS
ncbi:CYTH domain-containing protein [Vulcanococcus sp.]|jgi:CYTH domain-containing protein|uniref:CYTH domain-containing protein n=1 Tax=Vulcanococcus sp. TaxID=2856995 RepID=UPI00350D4709